MSSPSLTFPGSTVHLYCVVVLLVYRVYTRNKLVLCFDTKMSDQGNGVPGDQGDGVSGDQGDGVPGDQGDGCEEVGGQCNHLEGGNLGVWSKLKNVASRLKFPISLEPLIALYTISVGLNEVIRSNLIIEKICQNKLNYTSQECANLTNLGDMQKTVQENVADYEALYSSISFVPK